MLDIDLQIGFTFLWDILFCAHIIHQTLTYLKSHNKFHEDISIPKGLYSKDMFRFSSAFETQGETESVTEK